MLLQSKRFRISERVIISKCFLAATGFSIENGATMLSLEGDIKKYLTANSKTKILLVDSTKVNHVSLVTYARLEDRIIYY